MPDSHRTPPRPLDPPMVPIALAGLAIWAVLGVTVLVSGGPDEWARICLAGFLLGLPGLAIMAAHDRGRARRRAQP